MSNLRIFMIIIFTYHTTMHQLELQLFRIFVFKLDILKGPCGASNMNTSIPCFKEEHVSELHRYGPPPSHPPLYMHHSPHHMPSPNGLSSFNPHCLFGLLWMCIVNTCTCKYSNHVQCIICTCTKKTQQLAVT